MSTGRTTESKWQLLYSISVYISGLTCLETWAEQSVNTAMGIIQDNGAVDVHCYN